VRPFNLGVPVNRVFQTSFFVIFGLVFLCYLILFNKKEIIMAICIDDEKKMLKAAAMGAELRQGRYFRIKRVVKSFEDIDDYCDQSESKDGSMDTILKWMKSSSQDNKAVGDSIIKFGKVLDKMDKRLTEVEGGD
jgi:hypothetical protein